MQASQEPLEGSTFFRGLKGGIDRIFRPPAQTTGFFPVLLVSCLTLLVILIVPTPPPDLGPDAAWSGVLRWAHETHAQFGTDLVFTYGPLGFLVAPYTLSQPPGALIVANTLFCFAVALGVCLVAWRLAWGWRCALLGVLVLETANTELRADLLFEVGLFSWGLLCILEQSRRRNSWAAVLTLLAAFTALAKVIYLFIGGFSVLGVAIYLSLSGQRRLGLCLIPAFLGALCAGWVACGQAIAHLPSYLISAVLISRDYDQAAGLGGLPLLRFCGFLLGILAVLGVVLRICYAWESLQPYVKWRRVTLLAWAGSLLLLAWKHSMLRLDRGHFMDLAVFAPFAITALESLPCVARRAQMTARVIAIVTCFVSLLVTEFAFSAGPLAFARQVFSQCALHGRWIFASPGCRAMLEPELELRNREAQLPNFRKWVGRETVDVFGLHQAHAFLNGLNYHPRPVFQSYAAYNSALARRNEQFYLSPAAPAFVLFELTALEHRFPILDDSLASRALLINYEPVGKEGPFLLLRRSRRDPAKLTILADRESGILDQIDLRQYPAENLWMDISLKPTWLGQLLKCLYRLPAIRLSVWQDPTAIQKPLARRQVGPALLETGFMASPFLLNSEAVRDLFGNEAPFRPGAFSLEPGANSGWLWRKRIRVRLYRMDNFTTIRQVKLGQ